MDCSSRPTTSYAPSFDHTTSRGFSFLNSFFLLFTCREGKNGPEKHRQPSTTQTTQPSHLSLPNTHTHRQSCFTCWPKVATRCGVGCWTAPSQQPHTSCTSSLSPSLTPLPLSSRHWWYSRPCCPLSCTMCRTSCCTPREGCLCIACKLGGGWEGGSKGRYLARMMKKQRSDRLQLLPFSLLPFLLPSFIQQNPPVPSCWRTRTAAHSVSGQDLLTIFPPFPPSLPPSLPQPTYQAAGLSILPLYR